MKRAQNPLTDAYLNMFHILFAFEQRCTSVVLALSLLPYYQMIVQRAITNMVIGDSIKTILLNVYIPILCCILSPQASKREYSETL